MKILLLTLALLVTLVDHAFGQGAQADQIKRRARDLSNQNNVRQGIASPAQPASRPATVVSRPASNPPTPQQQNIARIQADLAVLKAGSPATATQKQNLVNNLTAACRGTKPSSAAVTALVEELTAAWGDKKLEPAKLSRLAQDIEAALNNAAMPSSQFDAIIADVQAILQVGGAKRTEAISAANKLKAVGLEVRRGATK